MPVWEPCSPGVHTHQCVLNRSPCNQSPVQSPPPCPTWGPSPNAAVPHVLQKTHSPAWVTARMFTGF